MTRLHQVGVIQGRLSPRPYPGLQAMPVATWKEEFSAAETLGFDFIEWIFSSYEYELNPLWSEEGRRVIRRKIDESGIPVRSVCADYFLEKPFFRVDQNMRNRNIEVLNELIKKSADIGARYMLLPVLEEAEIRTNEERSTLLTCVEKCIATLEEYDFYLGFETELDKKQYRSLCEDLGTSHIGAYYDAGNSTFAGHDMSEDMNYFGDMVLAVHVKDRLRGGSSVFLGTGDVDFENGVAALFSQGFEGHFTLQTYFEDDHLGDAFRALAYLKDIVERKEKACAFSL